MYAVLLLVLPLVSHGHGPVPLPSQNPVRYRHGCTPANRHCERCRHDGCGGGCGGPCFDYRRNFDYPWYPPYHRAVLEETPYDCGPRIVPVSDFLPGELPVGLPLEEEVPAPARMRPGRDESSPSDRPRLSP
jgi:hypothetical protein